VLVNDLLTIFSATFDSRRAKAGELCACKDCAFLRIMRLFGAPRMRFFMASALLVATMTSGHASDVEFNFASPPTRTPSPISEFRIGGFSHAIDGKPEEGSLDLNAEILFSKPLTSEDPWINALMPRPHIGGNLNLGGDTSTAYAGLTWTFNVTPQFFLEGSLGASINNGVTGANVPSGRNAVGCSFMFRQSGSIGYNITENLSVMGTVEHNSNADLCAQNDGITSAGVRFGYKF
jgi:lipid A 3-O-deacylase